VANISVVGPDGFLRSFPPLPTIAHAQISTAQTARALAGETGELSGVDADGSAVIATYGKVDIFGTPMALLVEQPIATQAQALAQLNMRALETAILVAVSLSLLGMLAMLLMSRPLRRVRASAGQLAERALSLPIRDSHRKDEVGQIVAALTTLWQDQWTARAQAKAATLRAGAFQRAANPMMLLDNAHNITESNDAMRDFLEQNLWEIRAGSPDFDPEDIICKSLSFFGADTLSTRSEGTSFSHVFNLGAKTILAAASSVPEGEEAYILLEMIDISESARNTDVIRV
jgi:hypothetical protein